jgi:hypothetical protein
MCNVTWDFFKNETPFSLLLGVQGVSAPYYISTPPTVPSTPLLPAATCSLFKSAVGNESAHVLLKWSEPVGNGCTVDRYVLETRSMSGDKWSESWKLVYMGPHLEVGDHTTLRSNTTILRQYRLKAGSKLGWSDWSPYLTVKGECRMPLPLTFKTLKGNFKGAAHTLLLMDVESVENSEEGCGLSNDNDGQVNNSAVMSEGEWSKVTLSEVNESTCRRHVSVRCSTNQDGSLTVNTMSVFGSVSTISISQEEAQAIGVDNKNNEDTIEKLSRRLKVDGRGDVVMVVKAEEEKVKVSESISGIGEKDEKDESLTQDNSNPSSKSPRNTHNEINKAASRPVNCVFLADDPITYHLELSSGQHTFLRLNQIKTKKTNKKKKDRNSNPPPIFEENKSGGVLLDVIFPINEDAVSKAQLSLTLDELNEIGLAKWISDKSFQEIGKWLCSSLVIDERCHTITLEREPEPVQVVKSDKVLVFAPLIDHEPPTAHSTPAQMVVHAQWEAVKISETSLVEDSLSSMGLKGESYDDLEKRIREKVLQSLGFSVSEALLKHVVSASIEAMKRNNDKGQAIAAPVTRQKRDSLASLTMMVNTTTANEWTRSPKRPMSQGGRPSSQGREGAKFQSFVTPGDP